jgi:EAL domain-containing protein (putative c-di-GMP-specific phosphodiesterase class I)
MAIVQRMSSKNEFLKQVQENITFAFQPIVNIHTGDCFGFEALLRNHKLVGVESIPALFDHACELGVLHHVDSILREIAVRRFAALPLNDNSMLFFNIDGRLFENADGELEETTTLFREFDLQTQSFCLELSEAYDNESARNIGDVLKICREQGFLLAIDDFGRGFSEMKML